MIVIPFLLHVLALPLNVEVLAKHDSSFEKKWSYLPEERAKEDLPLSYTYSTIAEDSQLPPLSEELKDRVFEKIILSNGMKVLLISDPFADQSAASMSVKAGSWNDPEAYPGMAHFCEHMLFMGTEKYPDSNGFSEQISNFQGKTNAFTSLHQTVYMFSARESGFLPLLDQFAHFFIDPIFSESNLSRELQAVDQEFALQKESDGWREYFVFRETGNPQHPYNSFVTGNSQTLSSIPQHELKAWHKNHYVAPRMCLAIYSSLPIPVLKEKVVEFFGEVPSQTSLSEEKFEGPLSSEKQKGHLTFIEPFFEKRNLRLMWEIPKIWANDPSKSADFIGYVLEKGSPKSLLQKLKKEALATGLSASAGPVGGSHLFFEVGIALTDLGVEKLEEVIGYVLQAIESLKTEVGIPESLFSEKNTLAQLGYQYQKRMDAFKYISQIGRTILDEDFATYPRNLIRASEYSSEKIEKILSFLTPDQCIMTCQAPQKLTKVTYDAKEKWLDTPYTIRKIPEKWMELWSGQPALHPDISLPDLNPLIPQNLTICPDPELGSVPVCIAESDLGKAYYIRAAEHPTPKAVIHLRIFSPEMNQSAKWQTLSHLYHEYFSLELEPLLENAKAAGLTATITCEPTHFHLRLSGFNDKLPSLLQEILTQVPAHSPTPEQFALCVGKVKKRYMNQMKAMPVMQARELLSTLIHLEKFHSEETLSELASISFEDFVQFHQTLFAKTYCQALFAGNISLKTAESAWLDILHSLGASPYPKEEIPTLHTLRLPEEEGPFLIAKTTNSRGYGAALLIDEGDSSFEKRGAQTILASAIHDPFFDTLRTKQKTGYIAQSERLESGKRLYQIFYVQSNTHESQDLLHRFELFLEDFCQDFEMFIPKTRFETIRQNTIETIKSQYRDITSKAELWETLAFTEKANFSYLNQRIQALEELSYERFSSLSKEWLSRSNRKRLAVLYTGKVESPFVYVPTNPDEFPKLVSYGESLKQKSE